MPTTYSSAYAQKVTASHLGRDAYLYVRQSSLRQVLEHQESTERQYALRERAIALGWPTERVVVIDNDLGQSGASIDGREGFQRLVADVGLGRAGLVMGLEVSRLARNSSDWHRLLEICALTSTLILDEDGLYDPAHFNDRLLLGLKGTMSEAELHFLKARMRGGALNKARRGELKMPLPVGFLYNEQDKVILDPDLEVQASIRAFFLAFRRLGSATATLKHFRSQELLFPARLRHGPNKGLLHWGPLTHTRALTALHNPRYAGAFFYGRTRLVKRPDGGSSAHVKAREDWIALLPDAHEGYITWEEFEANEARLRENAHGYGYERHKRAPREGAALLQGLVICGRCGKRMSVRYHTRKGGQVPDYTCERDLIANAGPACQHIPGGAVDEAIAQLILSSMTTLNVEVALAVQAELATRAKEADRLRRQHVERARYEADLARRRFLNVDPENRLVADQLEADWNEKLRALEEAQRTCDEHRERDAKVVDEKLRCELLALATDLPRLWNRPQTTQQDRKRIVRLIIEDVTLFREEGITLKVRLRSGALKTIRLPRPARAWELRQTPAKVVSEVDRLLDDYLEGDIARILNSRGFTSGHGQPFTRSIVLRIRREYRLKTRYERLRARRLLTVEEMAEQLNVCPTTVKIWNRHGLVISHPYTGKNECLYERPGPEVRKMQGKKLADRAPKKPLTSTNL